MTIIRAFILFLIFTLPVSASDKASAKLTETGRVIYYSDEIIEVKKGNIEHEFYFNTASSMSKAGKDVTIDEIELCQVVKITYLKVNGKMVIQKLEIIKESDCLAK